MFEAQVELISELNATVSFVVTGIKGFICGVFVKRGLSMLDLLS